MLLIEFGTVLIDYKLPRSGQPPNSLQPTIVRTDQVWLRPWLVIISRPSPACVFGYRIHTYYWIIVTWDSHRSTCCTLTASCKIAVQLNLVDDRYSQPCIRLGSPFIGSHLSETNRVQQWIFGCLFAENAGIWTQYVDHQDLLLFSLTLRRFWTVVFHA